MFDYRTVVTPNNDSKVVCYYVSLISPFYLFGSFRGLLSCFFFRGSVTKTPTAAQILLAANMKDMKTSVNSSQFLVASDWWLLQGVLRRSLGHFGAIDWQTGGPLTAWDFEVEFWLHNTHHDSKFWESQPTQPCRIYVTKVSPGVCCLISKHLHSIPSFGFSLKVSSPKGKHYHTLSYRRQLDHRWQSRQTNLCQRKASLGDMWFTGLHSRKIKNIE